LSEGGLNVLPTVNCNNTTLKENLADFLPVTEHETRIKPVRLLRVIIYGKWT